MTRDETMRHITENTALNQLRSVFSGRAAALEQMAAQRRAPDPVEMRGAEFDALETILDKAVELGLVKRA